jgi:hypothetical protein
MTSFYATCLNNAFQVNSMCSHPTGHPWDGKNWRYIPGKCMWEIVANLSWWGFFFITISYYSASSPELSLFIPSYHDVFLYHVKI